jgi:hypothetical protein
VALSVAAIFINAAPAFSTRHAAVWCSDFPLASFTTHQRSSAITLNLTHLTAHGSGNMARYAQTDALIWKSVQFSSVDPPASNYFDLFSSAPFIESSQCARKNFFSVGRNVFDGTTIGRSVVVI